MFCDSQAVLRTVSPASHCITYSSTQLTRCFNFIFLPEESVGIWSYNVRVCVREHSFSWYPNFRTDDEFSWHFMCGL